MAGFNRSASLKDTQRSIPIGTLAATVATSGLYLISVLIFGSFATREKLLADRVLLAEVVSVFLVYTYYFVLLLLKSCQYYCVELQLKRLLTATVAWPLPAIIYVGIIFSTLGAALQSLVGAPRLLAAIANDDILPVLNYFKVADGAEPHLATLFMAFICIACVVIGNLDLISPTITIIPSLLCWSELIVLSSGSSRRS
ncbi:Cation-chloride cotransporter 1-like protein [Drosera capensis]